MEKTRNRSIVIFDCDGVMFDSRRANINFYNHMLEHFGLPGMNKEQTEFVHMHTAHESVAHIFKGTAYVEAAQEYRMQMDYTPFIKDMIMEPGLKALLDWLYPKFDLAVATNRSNTIGEVLHSNGLSGYFGIVVSSLDVQNPKPHPEALTKILDFYGIGPEKAYYVGDSLVDEITASAAGITFISYKNRNLKADYHAEGLEDIVSILK